MFEMQITAKMLWSFFNAMNQNMQNPTNKSKAKAPFLKSAKKTVKKIVRKIKNY